MHMPAQIQLKMVRMVEIEPESDVHSSGCTAFESSESMIGGWPLTPTFKYFFLMSTTRSLLLNFPPGGTGSGIVIWRKETQGEKARN